MDHYAKLAALAFRVVSIVLFTYSVIGLLVATRVAATMTKMAATVPSPPFGLSVVFLPALAGFIIAILLYLAAPTLGRFAANGLSNTRDTA